MAKMKRRDVASAVLAILEENLEKNGFIKEGTEIRENETLEGDLGLDSINITEIMNEIESKFKIGVTNVELGRLARRASSEEDATVAEMIDVVAGIVNRETKVERHESRPQGGWAKGQKE